MSIFDKIKNRIQRFICIDHNNDYRSSIILSGTGRGGTTWVSDIINYDNEYRYMFEPFHPRRVKHSEIFGHRKYLREDSKDKVYYKAISKILRGSIRDPWIDSLNKKIYVEKRLIKDIRINFLLKWINNNFPEIPIIILMRHPIPTALSQIKFKLHTDLNDYLSQEDLIEDFLKPFKKEITKAHLNGDEFEQNIFIWCIENYVPLKQFRKEEILLTFYENFCETPDKEIEKLFSFLGKDFNESIYESLKKPSPVSRKWSAINTGKDLTNSWKEGITDLQIKKATEILSIFGMNNFYNEDSIPQVENIYSFMKS